MAALQGPSCLALPRHLSLLVFTTILQRVSVSALQWTTHLDPLMFYKDSRLVFRSTGDICKMCLWKDVCVEIEQDTCSPSKFRMYDKCSTNEPEKHRKHLQHRINNRNLCLQRCHFYQQTTTMLQQDSIRPGKEDINPTVKAGVDSLLYSLVESMSKYHPYKPCIPFVSKYTNCNKDNICLGCRTCDCDSAGQWNCTLTQVCRPETMRISTDRRSLVIVLENLKKEEISKNRLKRNVKEFSRSGEKEMTHSWFDWTNNSLLVDDEKKIYIGDIIIDTNDGKSLKHTLQDPLYSIPKLNSEFDGSSNKIKRSVETKNVSINRMAKEDNAVQDMQSLEVNKEYYKDSNSITKTGYDLSKIKKFVTKVLHHQNLNFTSAVLPFLKLKVKDLDSDYIDDEEMDPIELKSNKSKRSISIFEENANQMFSYEDEYDRSYIMYDMNKNIENNINQINKQDITEWLNDQHAPNQTHPKSKEQTSNTTITVNNMSNDEDFTVNKTYLEYTPSLYENYENNLNLLNQPEITEWLKDHHPLSTPYAETNKQTSKNIVNDIIESDIFVALESLDRSLSRNNKTNIRSKPPSDVDSIDAFSNDSTHDHANLAYENIYEEEIKKKYNFRDHEKNTVVTTRATTEYLTTTETIQTPVTEVLIDLLESAKNNNIPENNNGFMNTVDLQKTYGAMDTLDTQNTIDDEEYITPVQIMKRDVSQMNQNVNEVTPLTSKPIDPMKTKQLHHLRHTLKELIYNVLFPLNNIQNDKQKELNELIKIKNSLINFIKSSKNYDPTLNLNINKNIEKLNQNSYFSIYKLELVPDFDLDFKKTDVSILNQYMSNLKHDVYKVIKDVVGIQRLHSEPSKVPMDIKLLINAMKEYVHKEGYHVKPKNKSVRAIRRFTSNLGDGLDYIKRKIIKIVELLAKDVDQGNVLTSLSPVAAKIMKRVIKTYYTDEFAATGIRVHDSHYNLTTDLDVIGRQWDETAKKLTTGKMTSKIFRMMLLYQLLHSDISKMTDALFLINFTRTRRMMPLEEHVGDAIMSRINKDLENTYEQIQHATIRDNRSKQLQENSNYNVKMPNQKKKKESFLKQLKKLLVNSKREIMSIVHKKVPKNEIVKELARKRLETVAKERLAEYEDTMQRWQTQMHVASFRGKRSARPDVKRGMTNILPKYLRGKVHSNMKNKPQISKDGTKKNHSPTKNSETTADKTGIVSKKKSKTTDNKVYTKKKHFPRKKKVKTAPKKKKRVAKKRQ